MDYTWVKSLQRMQVGILPWKALGRFTLLVILNGEEVEALIDKGCERTLVRRAKGPFTPQILRMQCIHRDIREHRTKIVSIKIGVQMFTCWLGVIQRLDCGVLIGCDCPILAQLLEKAPTPQPGKTSGLQGNPLDDQGAELPLQSADIARLM